MVAVSSGVIYQYRCHVPRDDSQRRKPNILNPKKGILDAVLIPIESNNDGLFDQGDLGLVRVCLVRVCLVRVCLVRVWLGSG